MSAEESERLALALEAIDTNVERIARFTPSLRDQFAIHIAAALVMRGMSADTAAKTAYDAADQMLRVREERR